ncbi:hypothetical protein KR054_011229 [Drosophila jambulina]|nr:hypothetical protein KR054_011229 [Drosophila jambulina]
MERASWKVLILLQVAGLALSARDFILDQETIFTECLDPPAGAKPFNQLVDLTNFSSKRTKNGMSISGNITTIWDVDPTDRIEASIVILKMDKKGWKATALGAQVKDFCKEMYEKNTLYYPYSMKHVSNVKDVKDKCLNHKGTVIVIDPFDLQVQLGLAVPLSKGPHRIIVKISAVNKAGVRNPNNICMEIPGKLM